MKDITQEPGAVNWNGTVYHTVVSTEETGGRMSITDSLSPVGSGPPRHVHKDADETSIMLTGRCEVWLDGTTFEAGPGETVHIPRGTEHTFRVIGDEPSRHMVVPTPGGFEGFFYAMAEGSFRIPEDMNDIVAIGAQYQMEFTGPPLGA